MRQFQLVTTDGKGFNVNEELAKTLGVVKNKLQKDPVRDGDMIILSQVDSVVLKKVLQFTYHHRNDPVVAENDEEDKKNSKLLPSPWDQQFLNVDSGFLFQLIQASIYLDVPALKELTCRSAAQMLRGKSAQQIREMLNIKNDLTLAQQAQIMAESAWCEAVKKRNP